MLIARKIGINYSKHNSSMIRHNKSQVKEAEAAGVKSVPALVMNGAAFHINFGAGIDALK
jgi:glutaredoxin